MASSRCADSRLRPGFTLVELLVVIAIIGVLVALLLPAVQMVREAGRRIKCSNNLKQIGLSVQLFHDTNNYIPPSRPRDGYLTWPIYLLPYMEQGPLYDRFDIHLPYWRQPEDALKTPVSHFFCPSRRQPMIAKFNARPNMPVSTCGDYAGNAGFNLFWAEFYGDPNGVFNSGHQDTNLVVNGRLLTPKGRYNFASITDGLSQTIFIGEKAVNDAHLGEPGGWGDGSLYNGDEPGTIMRLGGRLFPIASNEAFPAPGPGTIPVWGSPHPQICLFVFGDGSVQTVKKQVDATTLGWLCARNDGEIVGEY